RRKRGKIPDPKKRVVINSLVCEGCGDCGEKSFCVAVLPKETEFGRKREIDQSGCNKDYSCTKGFCPSFVTVHGGELRKGAVRSSKDAIAARLNDLPLPRFKSNLEQPWNILITGVGGTGVVTIGALLGMAGHLEGKGASVLDQTGLAQKGGAVTTHVRIAKSPDEIHAVRIAAGEADLVLGCDMVVVNDYWALSKIRADRSTVVLNNYEAMPGGFTMHPDMRFPANEIIAAVRTALDGGEPLQIEATAIATALFGDAIAANLFMLGVAWQQGLVPVSLDALLRAIELNAASVEMNKTAFAWGRLAAIDPDAARVAAGLKVAQGSDAQALADPAPRKPMALTQNPIAELPLDDARLSRNLDDAIARRSAFLVQYQNAAYANRYRTLVDKVRATEAAQAGGSTSLTEAVARYAFKLMAYKDEYEVARLYTSGDFQRRVAQQFEGDYKLRFHLAPPLFSKKDADGHLIKKEYGPWMLTAFRMLARLRFLRGGMLDIFGRTHERRTERKLIADYFADIDTLLAGVSPDNLALAVDIASVPERIRGYGHVKEAHLAQALPQLKALMQRWRETAALRKAA
ncbi:MAG TPA: DUF6537 domain-containing protein, partial [Xanthomonadaceae bacterium]|nr:DUF6537 domain-containing protein [Xanthomonadaceae bacterium]